MRSQRARLEPHRRRRRPVLPDDIFHAGVDLYDSPTISDKEPVKRLVLRNLTTQEYVRGAELAQDQACTPDTWYTYWSVGELLPLRVCWSSDDSAGLPEEYKGNITRGPWAGHRFDIVLEDDIPRDAEGNVLPEWKDASDDILDDAWNLFSALYPKS
ncbi:hypothetical protein EXIGLDRAFT_731450 [Exidia glandulosa HHB12029]|uniref:Uncharacterized protein n=1 Tax=Exidia glandulosa HHB12029 TaxID=1314781 RepID=A0A165L0Q9_EXIGL|nr:hypothetical protein EXIGLDRAFT_731450 [Exidia glandulosa HHB12029]